MDKITLHNKIAELEQQYQSCLDDYLKYLEDNSGHLLDKAIHKELNKKWEVVDDLYNDLCDLRKMEEPTIKISGVTTEEDFPIVEEEDKQDDPFRSSEQEEDSPVEAQECNNMDCLCRNCSNFHPREI